MRKKLLKVLLILYSVSCYSQTSNTDWPEAERKKAEICGGIDSIISRKGKWTKASYDMAFPDKDFPPNQYNQVYARLNKISEFFVEAFNDLRGLEPTWYGGMRGSSALKGGPVPYAFSSLYKTYYCNTNVNKIMLGDETRNWIYVYVNHWGWFAEKLHEWDINNDGKIIHVYMLPPKVGEWKGKTLYAPTILHSSRAVVIGHNGKLPWHSLTKKQYLTGLRNMLTDKKNKDLASFDSLEKKLKQNFQTTNPHISAEQLEKINQQRKDELKKFQDNKEKRKGDILKSYYEKLKYIDDYLAGATNETLEKTAIIDPKYGTYGFKGVFGDEKKGGFRLIVFSIKYYDNSLPSYVPQFMILFWMWGADAISLKFKNQFEENFPLEKLKSIIDK